MSYPAVRTRSACCRDASSCDRGAGDAATNCGSNRTREAASNQLRQGVGNEAVHGFVDSLRKNAKIEIAEDRM